MVSYAMGYREFREQFLGSTHRYLRLSQEREVIRAMVHPEKTLEKEHHKTESRHLASGPCENTPGVSGVYTINTIQMIPSHGRVMWLTRYRSNSIVNIYPSITTPWVRVWWKWCYFDVSEADQQVYSQTGVAPRVARYPIYIQQTWLTTFTQM